MAKPSLLIVKKDDTSLKITDAKFEGGVLLDADTGKAIDLMALIGQVFEDGDTLKISMGRTVTEESEPEVE